MAHPWGAVLTQLLQHDVCHQRSGAVGHNRCQSWGKTIAVGADVCTDAHAQPRHTKCPTRVTARQQRRRAPLQVDAGSGQRCTGGGDDSALQCVLGAGCGTGRHGAESSAPSGPSREGGRQGSASPCPQGRYLGRAWGDTAAPRRGVRRTAASGRSGSSSGGHASRCCRSCGNRDPTRPTPSTSALRGDGGTSGSSTAHPQHGDGRCRHEGGPTPRGPMRLPRPMQPPARPPNPQPGPPAPAKLFL